MLFWWWPVIYRGFALEIEKVRSVFFTLTSPWGHAVLQGATSSKRLWVLEFILQKFCNWAAECFSATMTASILDFHTRKHYVHADHSECTTAQLWIPCWQSFWSLTACLHFWTPNPVTWRSMCTCRKLTWTLTSHPQTSDVACACDAS